MSNEIATYTMIHDKLSLGSTGNECPTKTLILAISSLIIITNESTYGANECVRIDDINKEAEYIFLYHNHVGDTIWNVGASGSLRYVTVESCRSSGTPGSFVIVPFNFKLLPDWLSNSSIKRIVDDEDTVVDYYEMCLDASPNETTSSRTGTVIIELDESGLTLEYTVILEGAAPSTTYTFSVNPYEVDVDYTGGSGSVTITSYKTVGSDTYYVGYSIDYNTLPSWASFDYSTDTFTIQSTTSSSSRSAKVYFDLDESGERDYAMLTQSGYTSPVDPDPPTPPVDDYAFTWSDGTTANKSMDLPYHGSSAASTFSIISTNNGSSQSWSVSSSPSWVNASDSGNTLSVTVDANSGSARNGTIVLTQAGSGNTLEIDVSQAAYVESTDTYSFEIRKSDEEYSGKTSITFDDVPANTAGWSGGYATRGRKNGEVFTERSFSSDSSWISVSSDGSYTVSNNTSASARSGTITITQGESGLECYIYINQVGADSYIFEVSDNGESLSHSALTVSYDVTSTNNGNLVGYSVTSDVSWAVVTTTMAGLTQVEVTENPSASERYATITFTLNESGKTIEMLIAQKEWSLSLTITTSSGLLKGVWYFLHSYWATPDTLYVIPGGIYWYGTEPNFEMSDGELAKTGDTIYVYVEDGTEHFYATSFTLRDGLTVVVPD